VADLLKFTKSLFQFITKQENLHHVKGSQERVLKNENKIYGRTRMAIRKTSTCINGTKAAITGGDE
jgi:hypothetical protein